MKRIVWLLAIVVVFATVGSGLAAPLSQEDGMAYIVQKDDWLSKLAEKYLGDMMAYPEIVEATNRKAAEDSSFAQILDPNLIEVGQQVWIPIGENDGGSGETAEGLTPEAVANATYLGIDEAPFTLSDGEWEGEPYVPDGASRPMATLAQNLTAFGDLNDDGLTDAAVILGLNTGGSGVFVYLAAVLAQDGQAVNVAVVSLGDRPDVESVQIEDGQIKLDMLTQGPDDPMCCPTQQLNLVYVLQDDQLVEEDEKLLR